MKFVSSAFVLFILSLSGFAQTTVRSSADLATEQELVRIAQELYDAIAVGNKAPWEKCVAADVIYTAKERYAVKRFSCATRAAEVARKA